MKKCVVIYNSHSGRKIKKNFLATYVDILLENGYDPEIIFSKYKGNIIEVMRNLPDDVDLVISVGGDGTFNEAVNGNLERKNKLLLAHIPLGTTNDIGAMFGYGTDIIKNLRLLLDGEKRNIDICTVNNKAFVYVAGFGKFMTIPFETERTAKKRLGYLAYLNEAVKHFFGRTRLHELTYRVNGEEVKGLFSFILISNANHIAGISNFYNNVYLDDKKFEVLFCNLTKRKDIVKSLLFLTTGDITKVPGFYFYKTDKLEIDFSVENDKWCVDGEELIGKARHYKIDIVSDFPVMIPKKNIKKVFLSEQENK